MEESLSKIKVSFGCVNCSNHLNNRPVVDMSLSQFELK